MIQKTFTKACMDFFGKKHNQTLTEFAAELKTLTTKDRSDLVKDFAVIGIAITPAPKG